MEIKLIALDIDGTLFNNSGKILRLTKKTLIKAQKSQIKVVLNSGRLCSWIIDIAKEILIDKYSQIVIGGNGSEILNIKNKTYLYRVHFENKEASGLINFLDTIKELKYALVSANNNDVVYWNNENSLNWFEKKRHNNLFFNMVIDRINIPLINQIMLFTDDYEIKNIIEKNIKKNYKTLDLKLTGYGYFEISKKNVNKWTALLEYCNYLNNKNNLIISPEQIMSFGDQLNDYEMLKNSGYGIAMGNAVSELKQVAYDVCPDNENDGIAIAINKYIFNKK